MANIHACYLQNVATIENGEHGALVQQILDTKKELEDGAQVKRPGVEIEKDAGFSDFNRQREREATQRDVQKLKDSIQVNLIDELTTNYLFSNCLLVWILDIDQIS